MASSGGKIGTHLNRPMTRGRAARGPRERGVEIGHVDEVVTAQLLFGIREGTIQNLRFAIHDAHGGRDYPALFGQTAEWKQIDPNTWDRRQTEKQSALNR